MSERTSSTILKALGSGLAGALALTLLHETARHLRPHDAPRMDVLGKRGLRKLLRQADLPQPNEPTAYALTMLGDVVSNGLYYSLVGTSTNPVAAGAALGLAAGVGGVLLPGPLGLGNGPSNRTTQTRLMTVAWYLVGGLVAGSVARR